MKRILTLALLLAVCLTLLGATGASADGDAGYTVEFTSNDLQYVLQGNTSVPVSEILSTLGLTGAVEAVEISDTSLFSASNETGEWIVTAHRAFDTTEWMKVTINGVVYEITVTDTETSVTTVGGTDYTLFTGFTATAGTTVVVAAYNYSKMVDGDLSSSWHLNGEAQPYYIEFNSDDPIIPKGYIFNTYDANNFKPTGWVLKAKADADDSWTTLSSKSGSLASGQEFQYACDNSGNSAYKYFRFEVSNSSNNIWLTEIRLYGFEYLTYTHLTVKAATCTEVGIKQDCYQRNDGKYFNDETGTTELQESDVIAPMIPHSGQHHEATDTNIEYWQCSMCGKYFSDEACTTEITEEGTKIYSAISYLDATGAQQSCTNYMTVESNSTDWNNAWYVVSSNTTIADRITVSGTVNLILVDGATLTASKGITVGNSATFNVYAQSDDEATMGAIVADATNDNANWYAGIGGVEDADAGTITINGGKINAIGFVGAGIGSGGGTSTVGTITINGGIVTAHDSKSYGAGIGGGFNGGKASTINLNGGIINAAGIGSGYQGGDCSMTVNISDGIRKIVATPVQGGACIGKGVSASGTVTVNFISGGNIVTGADKDAVFYDTGEGSECQIRTGVSSHSINMSDELKAHITVSTERAIAGETVILTLGTAVDSSTLKVNDGTSDLTLTDAGNRQYTFTMPAGNVTVTATVEQSYAVTLPANMEVVSATNAADANGKYITGTTVNFKPSFPYTASDVSDGTNTLTATDGVYSVTVADADITVNATIGRSSMINLADATGAFTAIDNDVLTGTTSHTVTIAGGANITLSGATINGGILCNGTATITLVGTNSVSGATNKAGIEIGGSGSTLTIRGNGSLTANGGSLSAGIGLSRAWDPANDVIGGDIVIEGGNITANGGSQWGAGIGTGVIYGKGSAKTARIGNITIKGGTVKATGGSDSDGIGTGYTYSGCTNAIGTVTIYDSIDMVDASSIKDFASVVYMHGETNVTASKTEYFAIGEDGDHKVIAPKDNTDYTITIADGIEFGTVTADKVGADEGDTVTLTVTPDNGYALTDLTVTYTDGEGTVQTITPVQDGTDQTKYTFTMPEANVQVSATFRRIRQIFIQWSGYSHSSIDLISGFAGDEGDYTAIEGDTVTFHVTPESGYGVSSVSVTEDYGEHVITVTDLGEGMYSFVMPDYNVNLYSECIAVRVDIPTGHGTVTITPEIPEVGNTVTLAVKPDSGYALDTLTVTKDDTDPAETVEITPTETDGEYTYTMPAANVTVSATFKKTISKTVTFKVVNGSWDEGEGDAATAERTVTLTGCEGDTLKLAVTDIPAVGGKPNDTYKAGSWDVTPSTDTAITEATTYIYTYAQKEAATVTKAPTARTLTYNGKAQALVTAGEAIGGTMQYALGNTTKATGPYTTSIPTATDAGTYYVWYRVTGDENHMDAPAAGPIEVIVKPAFGTPDFTLPKQLDAIDESAFEGIAASVIDIPASCASIGDRAFRNCPKLTQIRIPAGCALGEDVFDGCARVYVYGAAGSPAEAYCNDPAHGNCVFVSVE